MATTVVTVVMSTPSPSTPLLLLVLALLTWSSCCTVSAQAQAQSTSISLMVYSDALCSAPVSGLSLSSFIDATGFNCNNDSSQLAPLQAFGTTPVSSAMAGCNVRNSSSYYLSVTTYTGSGICPNPIPASVGFSQLLVAYGVPGVCSQGKYSVQQPNSSDITTSTYYAVGSCAASSPSSAASATQLPTLVSSLACLGAFFLTAVASFL